MRKSNIWLSLASATFKLFHSGGGIEELSKELGVKTNTCYRYSKSFLNISSSLPVPFEIIIKAMKKQNFYEPLKIAGNYCGFLLTKISPSKKCKESPSERILQLQKLHVRCVENLTACAQLRSRENLQNAEQSLFKSMEFENSILRQVRTDFGQCELPLNC